MHYSNNDNLFGEIRDVDGVATPFVIGPVANTVDIFDNNGVRTGMGGGISVDGTHTWLEYCRIGLATDYGELGAAQTLISDIEEGETLPNASSYVVTDIT